MRPPRPLLEVVVNAQVKTYEQKLADLIRRLGSDHEGEVIATVRALGRILASRSLTFTDLGDGLEKLASGGLTQGEMERIRDAAYAKGVADAERQHAEGRAVYGLRADGLPDWEAIAAPLPAAETSPRRSASSVRRRHEFAHDLLGRAGVGEAGQVPAQLVSPNWREDRMTVMADEATVRQFITIIGRHVAELAKGNGRDRAFCSCAVSARMTGR